MMLYLVLAFMVGLLIGWNVLPQPAWIKSLYDKVITWIKTKLGIKSE